MAHLSERDESSGWEFSSKYGPNEENDLFKTQKGEESVTFVLPEGTKKKIWIDGDNYRGPPH